ncbi:MAG TPA: GNVR domain-containing protein [Pyrinomonadaceae bacterium]|nr:GNVR domain-containing protein [Pyrinomonadaceae bacterium]
MSTEFRQRTPGEFARIAWKRKWMILLPAIAVAAAIGLVVFRLPDVYASSTLIVVKPSTLPSAVVPTLSEDGLTRQLASITQVVTSRSSLEPLVEKYDLYKVDRMRGEPMELVIDRMRRNISVEVNTSRNDITNGFNITYRGHTPRTTQAVTAELAGKYIDEQTKNTINSSASARQFIDQQVKQTKDELDAIDKQRLEFMQKNVGSLPSEAVSLVGQLNGLREQQKAYISEVGRLQDRRSAIAGQVALMKRTTEQAREEAAETLTDPKTTMAWSTLVARKADVEAQLTRMLQELRPKHPDVIAKQAELDSVKEAMDQMINEWKEKIKEKEAKLRSRPDITVANLETELRLVDGEIKRQQTLLGQIETQITEVVQRINTVPGTEVALGALDREYQTKKSAYDQLLSQQQRIALGAEAASQQQAEGIEVIDPANLPGRPVAPKRFTLLAGGLGLGLVIGLLLAGAFEVPRLLTIQTSEDAAHYTNLPVLIAIPELLTPKEAISRPRRRKLLLAAGVVATIAAIPALALILKASQVFERFVA